MRRSLSLLAAAAIAGVGLSLATATPSAAAMPGLAQTSGTVTKSTATVEKVHYKKRWRKRNRIYFRKRHVPYYVYNPYYYDPYYYNPYYYGAYPGYYVHRPYKRRRHHGGINFGIVIGF